MVAVYIEGAPLAVAEQTWRLTRFLRAALVSDFAPNLDVRYAPSSVLFYLDFHVKLCRVFQLVGTRSMFTFMQFIELFQCIFTMTVSLLMFEVLTYISHWLIFFCIVAML